MLVNLVVIGLVAKVIFGAVDTGLKKRTAEHPAVSGDGSCQPLTAAEAEWADSSSFPCEPVQAPAR
jgi:hypothetical protein